MTKLKAMRLKKELGLMAACEGVNKIGRERGAKGLIDPSRLSQYESGGIRGTDRLGDFCKFYGCTMEELIGESDE